MASTINALSTGSGGLVSTGDASGQLQLQANGSTKVTVSSSGVNLNGLTFPTTDGTNGQVLQTNGSGTLSFATPAGGAWTYLSTVTASNSATVDVETTFSSTYDVYAIVISGFVAQTDNVSIRFEMKINGSYQTTNYRAFSENYLSNTGGSGGFNSTAAQNGSAVTILPNVGNDAGEHVDAIMYVSNPASTSLWKTIYGQALCITSAATTSMGSGSFWAQNYASAEALTGVKFYFSSGNIVSGSARLYGIKNS
jgi:hypothetical protein